MKTHVIIAISQQSFRELLAHALRTDGGYEVSMLTAGGMAILEKCASSPPDVVIADSKYPDISVPDLVRRMRIDFPQVRVLVFSGSGNQELTREVLGARPHGFVHRDEPLAEFYEALRAVVRGSRFISNVGSRLLDVPSDHGGGRSGSNGLTKRETEVLTLLARGGSSKEIGAELGISARTVDHYRADLMTKLGVNDVAGLIRYALAQGLLKATK